LQNGEKKKNKSKTFVNNFVFERNGYTSHPPSKKKYIKTGWRWSSKFTPVLNTSATRAHKPGKQQILRIETRKNSALAKPELAAKSPRQQKWRKYFTRKFPRFC
jgi:hypothetical protein